MAIRTGKQYLNDLKATDREIWLGSERIQGVVDHPQLEGGANAIADYYDLHHREADSMVIQDPENGEAIAALRQ